MASLRKVLLSRVSLALTLVWGPVTQGMVSRTDLMRRKYCPGKSRSNSVSGSSKSQVPVSRRFCNAAPLRTASETGFWISYSRL